MTAVENIELYRYEIHSLLKAFYPGRLLKFLSVSRMPGDIPTRLFCVWNLRKIISR